jgi:hypothetical protein
VNIHESYQKIREFFFFCTVGRRKKGVGISPQADFFAGREKVLEFSQGPSKLQGIPRVFFRSKLFFSSCSRSYP